MPDYSNTRIQFRRGTATEWSSENPVLGVGEPGYDTTNKTMKVGDGSSNWASLSGISSATHVHSPESQTIGNFVGTHNNWLPSVEADTLRVQPTSALIITGVSTSYGLTEFTLVNEGYANVYLKHQDSGSDANNRLYNPAGTEMFVYKYDSAHFIYDTSINRWLITGSGQATKIQSLTQTQYDALTQYDPSTLYIITGP